MVGIVGSFRTRWQSLLRLARVAPSEEEILRNLLIGEFKSRTNLPFRGKGLPAIAKALSRRQIENLTIITNGVVADVSRGTIGTLTTEFAGTLIYWEVGKENDNYKNQRV